MTPTRGSRDTLATATALQRTRAAATQRDREAALATEREGRVNAHPSEHDRLLSSGCKQLADPPVAWTPESGDTDADDEVSEDEEEYEHDAKTNEDDEQDKAELPEAAAIAAAENADASLIQTPPDERSRKYTMTSSTKRVSDYGGSVVVIYIATDCSP